MDQEQGSQLSIELKPEIANGTYSNLAIISHSKSEFVMDFAAKLPGLPKSQVVSRVIMTPLHMKEFMMALMDNIQKYESNFGTIEGKGGTLDISNLINNGRKS